MKNLYPTQEQSLWLKSLFFTLLACFITANANAQDESTVVDFGKMELEKTYEIKGDFKDYKGFFVAEKSGTLTANGSFSCLLLPYTDADCLTAAEYTHSFVENGESFSLNVEAGKTYYLFLGFSMSDGTFKMTMNADTSIKLVSTTPENGSVFNLNDGGIVSVQFNNAIQLSAVMINCNQTMTEIPYNIQNGSVAIDIKDRIYGLMENGNIRPGEKFSIILDGICAINDEKIIYGDDGILVLTYQLGEMPIALDSTINVENNPFLSYWMEGDKNGLITLTFDGELQNEAARAKQGIATITAGELEAGAGGYYYEEIPYTVEGKNLYIDLTGKLRRAKDMLSPEFYPEFITIKVKDIRGANGQLAYFPGKGGLGSFAFDMPYKEVKAEPISEFTPGEGSELDKVESIEIWVTDYKKIKHDGIVFICENGMTKDSVVVTDFESKEDTEYEGAYILNVKVPAQIKAKKGNVTITFLNLECIDGLDHSTDLSARYAVTTAIASILKEAKNTDIYQINGVKVNTQNLKELPNGAYLVNGKKIIICNK